jgi:hypothetical protein
VPLRLAIAVPAALLVTIAAAQMVLARTAALSPWKGGGFGMFASIDGEPFREVRVFVAAPDRSEEIALPASLADQAARVATFPHDRALRALAEAVAARERRRGQAVTSVRVEVWRADVSPALESTAVKLRELRVDIADVAPDRRAVR